MKKDWKLKTFIVFREYIDIVIFKQKTQYFNDAFVIQNQRTQHFLAVKFAPFNLKTATVVHKLCMLTQQYSYRALQYCAKQWVNSLTFFEQNSRDVFKSWLRLQTPPEPDPSLRCSSQHMSGLFFLSRLSCRPYLLFTIVKILASCTQQLLLLNAAYCKLIELTPSIVFIWRSLSEQIHTSSTPAVKFRSNCWQNWHESQLFPCLCNTLAKFSKSELNPYVTPTHKCKQGL